MEWDFDWNPDKHAELKLRHGFGFDRFVLAISEGNLLDEREHPNQKRYPNQRQFVVTIERYIWVVPFVADGRIAFLKTMFPSRKAMREFIGGKNG